jgi:hypothetical protein
LRRGICPRGVPCSLIVEEWWKFSGMEILLLASAGKVLMKVVGLF